MQGRCHLMKQQDGAIEYKGNATSNSETIYNTIQHPQRRSYQLTLSDGTKVWLNSLTSLHYPVFLFQFESEPELNNPGRRSVI